MAKLQNQYYINEVKTIRLNMPAQKKVHLETIRQRMQGRSQTFSPAPVTPGQIEKIISNLKNSTDSGLDMVDTYIMKLVNSTL